MMVSTQHSVAFVRLYATVYVNCKVSISIETLTPFSSPVRISGPLVSRAMATDLPFTRFTASRTLAMVWEWYCTCVCVWMFNT